MEAKKNGHWGWMLKHLTQLILKGRIQMLTHFFSHRLREFIWVEFDAGYDLTTLKDPGTVRGLCSEGEYIHRL